MFVDRELHEANKALWQGLQRGESRQGQFRLVTWDKSEIWVQGVFNPITDAYGKPFKVVAYLNDVTKVRQEAVLNAAFRGALNRLDANVMVANNDLEIIFVNPAAEKMLSRAQADFRRELPAFDAARLLGSSLDTLTRDPARLRGEIEGRQF